MDAAGVDVRAVSSLFPGSDDRRFLNDFLTARLDQAMLRIPGGSVVPDLDMTIFRQRLESFDFQSPRLLSDLLPWVIDQLEHGVVQLTHPRYFGLFNPAPSFPSECAERIVAAFNPQLASSRTSPVAVEIEAHVIRSIARRAGLPSGTVGHFTSGGSEANFTALTCALTRANSRYTADGVRAFSGSPTLYVSEDAHLAWFKIAHQSGIGRASVRLIDTDASGRMDPQALATAIAGDRAQGRVPVMIVATAGTTGGGMIDPLADCATMAAAVGAWFHVDAAWGGALIASERLRGLLAGIGAADSITIDAHKWFATTMACGMFMTTRADILAESFQVARAAASFMPSNIRDLDPYVTTAQWSRRFLGLRLFLSLAAAGWAGYAEHVERSVELTELLRQELTSRGWNAANRSSLAVLCVDPPPGFPDAASIVAALVSAGTAWVATTRFRGRDVVRICVTNGRTTPEDVLALVDLLQAAGSILHPLSPMFPESPIEARAMTIRPDFEYQNIIDEICLLRWHALSSEEMTSVAWAYYFFSIQFRENLKTARSLYPLDEKLQRLEEEECDTDNLSPWPGVAHPGERMNHDEYMRRTLDLAAIDIEMSRRFESVGQSYLIDTRKLEPAIRAASIASYEDGGLERVFKAILGFSGWETPLLRSFEHFLVEHVRFDSDPEQGHGALSRHITVDDRILPLWEGFRQLLITCVPSLSREAEIDAIRVQEADDEFEMFPLRAGRLDANPPVHEAARHLPAYDDPVRHP